MPGTVVGHHGGDGEVDTPLAVLVLLHEPGASTVGLEDGVGDVAGAMHRRGIAARLGRIPEPPYHDDFYRRVAASYSALARQVPNPAAELAEENELPVTTVHTWVKQARRRGFLPPGRKGKAG